MLAKSIDRRYQMFAQVENNLAVNHSIVDSIPALKDYKDDFQALLQVIRSGMVVGATSRTGVAIAKKNLISLVAGQCETLANGVYLYAKAQKDVVLQKKLPLTAEKLHYDKGTDMIGTFYAVVTEATAIGKPLEHWGITMKQITEVTDNLQRLVPQMNSPKNAQLADARKRELFLAQVKGMDDVLDSLDKMANLLKNTQPTFYADYKKSRLLPAAAVKKQKDALELEPPVPENRFSVPPFVASVQLDPVTGERKRSESAFTRQ